MSARWDPLVEFILGCDTLGRLRTIAITTPVGPGWFLRPNESPAQIHLLHFRTRMLHNGTWVRTVDQEGTDPRLIGADLSFGIVTAGLNHPVCIERMCTISLHEDSNCRWLYTAEEEQASRSEEPEIWLVPRDPLELNLWYPIELATHDNCTVGYGVLQLLAKSGEGNAQAIVRVAGTDRSALVSAGFLTRRRRPVADIISEL